MNIVACAPDQRLVGQHVIVTKNGCGQGGSCTQIKGPFITIRTPIDDVLTYDTSDGYIIEIEEPSPAEDCVNFNPDECRGPVDYHTTGRSAKAWPRCDFHQEQRQASYDSPNSSERFADSDLAPSYFHRSWGGANDMGEHWSEDDY